MSSPIIFQGYVNESARPLHTVIFNAGNEPSRLSKMLHAVWDAKWGVALSCMAMAMIAALLAIGVRPEYETNLLIHIEPGSARQVQGALGDMRGLFAGKNAAGAEAELLQSRTLLAKSMETLDSYVTVEPAFYSLLPAAAMPCARSLSLSDLARYRECVWNSARISIVRFNVPPEYVNHGFQVTALENGRFLLSGGSGLADAEGMVGQPLVLQTAKGPIEMLVSTLDAANGIRFGLTRHSKLAALEQVRKQLTVTELRNNSSVVSVALRGNDPATISALLSEMARQYMAGMSRRSMQDIDRTEAYVKQQLAEAQRRLQESEGRYRQFRSGKAVIDPGEDARSNAQQLVAAKAQKLDLEQKRAELLVRFTSNHPAVSGIDAQIQNVSSEIRRIGSYIKTLPSLEQESLALARELKINTETYESLLNMDRQVGLAKAAAASGGASLVDMPVMPERPVAARFGAVIASGALAGLIAGIFVALLKYMRHRGIKEFSELERKTGLPVYVSVPHSRQQKKLAGRIRKAREEIPLLAQAYPLDLAVETLRQLRATLQFSLIQQKNNVVLLTSAAPNTGKSFIVANLAVLLGSGNKKVLVIDADLRNGSLAGYFHVDENSSGLSDVLLGAQGLEGIIHRNVHAKVDFISSGRLRGNSTELLMQPDLEKILILIAPYYDVVLVNGAPVLEAADCLTLGSHAGAVYVVARAGVSTASELGEMIKRFRQVGVSPKGFIFNDSGKTSISHGYAHHHSKFRDVRYTLASARMALPDTREVK